MQDDPSGTAFGITPPPRPGERVGVLFVDADGARTEVLGYLTAVSPAGLSVIDRHGVERTLTPEAVEVVRRVPVARGRRPDAAPRALLDALAERAGASGAAWVTRISDLLAGRTPPASVPPWGATAAFGATSARHEGEWVTLPGGTPQDWVAAAWWATRMGARSVQVRTTDADVAAALAQAGFTPLP